MCLSNSALVRSLALIVLLSFSDILSIKKNQRIEERFVWVKTALERSPINLGKHQLIITIKVLYVKGEKNQPTHQKCQIIGQISK